MSELLVNVVRIDSIEPHPNADKLEIVKLGGWQIVSGKGNYAVGDLAVHVPPDAMVPRTLADQWGVTPYLSFKQSAELDSSTPGGRGRVRAAKLRGIPSYGFLAPNDTEASLGTDVAAHYGITKYEPPPPPVGLQAGQQAKNHPLFHTYTDIGNLRNFRDKLNYNEPLVVMEKIHGTNSRVGWVRIQHEDGTSSLELAIGTHHTQRKPEDPGVYGMPLVKYGAVLENIKNWILTSYDTDINSIIIFGEIYGAGVQDLHYGAKKEKDYRVFDISVNGKYLPWSTLEYWHENLGLPLVPCIALGVFDFKQLIEFAQGNTTLTDDHIKEGIVVRPLTESTWGKGDLDPYPKRTIFKLIGDDYLTRKNGSEYH